MKDRSKYLGGYNVASIVNVNPYESAEHMAMVKLGMLEPDEVTEPMKMGLLFEGVILDRAEDDLGNIGQRGLFIQHPKYDFLGGTIDGIAKDYILVDAKNLNQFSLREWEDNVPSELYIVQINYYAALLNALGIPIHEAKLAVVFGGQTFRIYNVELDAELGEMLIQKGIDFWTRYIINGEPLDLSAAPVNVLTAYYKKAQAKEVTIDDTAGNALVEYHNLNAEIKTLTERKDAAKATVMAFMQDANKAVYNAADGSIYGVSWGMTKGRSGFDSKAFAAEHPDLYAAYQREGEPYRTFRTSMKTAAEIESAKQKKLKKEAL